MSLQGTVWTPIGPSALAEGSVKANGQVTSIAINPNNPNIIYVGFAWGGIWRSDDAGNHWTPIFDRALALGIGEPGGLAIDPVDTSIIYAGTSPREGSQFAGSSATQPAAGLFKSTDGGASWVQLGSGYPDGNVGNAILFVNQFINVVLVDPANNQIVYLASSSGFFRSVNGGLNWTPGAGASGDMRSLVLDTSSPASSRVLFAGVGGAGVVRSTDGGNTWSSVLNASTPALSAKLAGGSFGHVVVALAPPTSPTNPAGVQVLYASMSGFSPAPDPVAIFLSKDQGNSWTARNVAALPGTSYPTSGGGYCLEIAVDPASPGDGVADIIYFGDSGQAKSIDAGANFAGVGVTHADTHAWAFVRQPAPPSVVFCGNDGGFFSSTDGGATWTGLNNNGVQTCLFYNFDIKPDATASVTVGALQDNGIATNSGGGWTFGFGGDGWDVAYDGQIAKKVYSTSNSGVLVSSNDGAAYGGVTQPGGAGEITGGLSPVATDPSTGNVVYVSGATRLWRSSDGGATWPKSFPFVGPANHVAVAPTNGNNVVVALGSQVFVSTNASGAFTFTDISRNLPGLTVARAVFDPNDPTIIYAVLSGFSGPPGRHVFRTTIAASAWSDISPSDPDLDLPFNAIALDGSETPAAIYAGTDFGVVQSLDAGASWSVLDSIHLPRAPVFDLKFHQGVLRAATFGRGIFAFVKPTGPAIAVDPEAGLAFGTVCSGPVRLALKIFNVGATDLLIKSVQRLMGSASIKVLATPGTPLTISPGEEIDFEVVYTPSTPGSFERATIRISSDDPTAPLVDLNASGFTGAARAKLLIADGGNFGSVCRGSFTDEALTINNSGPCALVVSGITSSSPDFIVPFAPVPLLVGAGESIAVPIRFQPTALGPHSATLKVISNDPSGPHQLFVSGTTPSGTLAVTGSTRFGGVRWRHREQRSVSICNVGSCPLHVASVALKHPHRHFRIILNPFPATIEPGSCLAVVIEYKATERIARPCELVIGSDDPVTPVKTLELLAFTIQPEEREEHHEEEEEEEDRE
jgi:hypothetical protein